MAKGDAYVPFAFIITLYIINPFVQATPTRLATPWENKNICFPYESVSCHLDEDILTPSVFYPSTVSDIGHLIKSSYASCSPFKITARGQGHALGHIRMDGVMVLEMRSLVNHDRIKVGGSDNAGFYVDAGGEQLWIDVLRKTMKHELAPVSWTDYLHLTVGGTLSNAGVSGQTFMHGPQISNVVEMDIITGKGDFATCSENTNSELFFGVLGGLGQFGVITRARLFLQKAPTRVRWVRMMYVDFGIFTKDQEHLISLNGKGANYVEGSLIMKNRHANNWRASSFFSFDDELKVNSLASKHGVVYNLEVAKYYDEFSYKSLEEELDDILSVLSFENGFIFQKDITYFNFLTRVKIEEPMLQTKTSWNVDQHPWLNLFVSKSSILDFNQRVLIDIIKKENKSSGPFLIYPMNRNKWDNRTSAVIPEEDEDVFYTVSLLHTTRKVVDKEAIDDQNKRILKLCEEIGINFKQYLPQYYKRKEQWKTHFGNKWMVFEERKAIYDPKMIFSYGMNNFIDN